MVLNIHRIVLSTAFTFLLVVLFCLIIISPVDAIYQCYTTRRLINIFFIAGAYIITFLLALLIYASRILTNRSVLSGIPKAWIPVEKEDVSKSVRRLVVEGLARSAIIAYQARPRDTTMAGGTKFEDYDDDDGAATTTGGGGEADSTADYRALLVDRERPPWGHIEHPGWSSPSSQELPNLPYRIVLQELPHLIEAKAVSLAPPDPLLMPHSLGQAVPDTRVVEVLQRPASMGLREYIQHLTSLGLIDPPELAGEFVALYERARFSSRQLYEVEFRGLMHVFAELLRAMKSLSVQMVEEIRDGSLRPADSESFVDGSSDGGESGSGSGSEEDTDTADFDDASLLYRGRRNNHNRNFNRHHNNGTSLRLRASNASFDTWGEDDDGGDGARRRRRGGGGGGEGGHNNNASISTHTTPSTRSLQVSQDHGRRRRRRRSRSRPPSRLTTPQTPSVRSLRRPGSNVSVSGSSSGGSVIRLVDSPGPSELPYVIDMPDNTYGYECG